MTIPAKISRKPKCQHVHYSGRRCASFVKERGTDCGSHKGLNHRGDDRCRECKAMKQAFGLL